MRRVVLLALLSIACRVDPPTPRPAPGESVALAPPRPAASDAGSLQGLLWTDAGDVPNRPHCDAGTCSSPKRVRCGDIECPRPAKVCYSERTPDQRRSCMPEVGGWKSDPRILVPYYCDENADCAAGEVCCEPQIDDAGYFCSKAPCPGRPACTPGGTCASGFRCVDDVGESTRGPSWTGAVCVPESVKVSCGSETCNREQACITDGTSSECVERSRWAHAADALRIECRGAADCGPGYFCCWTKGRDFAGLSFCAGRCPEPGTLCRTDADCPPWGSARVCLHDESHRVAGSGTCDFPGR